MDEPLPPGFIVCPLCLGAQRIVGMDPRGYRPGSCEIRFSDPCPRCNATGSLDPLAPPPKRPRSIWAKRTDQERISH